jgi:AcrR family transcriptional regulator
MPNKEPHPLLAPAITAAETLISQEHFSIENLCHALDCGLKELGDAIGTLDELLLHVNGRFMGAYLERAAAAEAGVADDVEALVKLATVWYDHAQEQPQRMKVLLQHRWSPGFVRPDWYLARVKACFAPVEARLRSAAPAASEAQVAAVARAIYAQICGLHFLTSNERATPAGIADQRKLLALSVTFLLCGLKGPAAQAKG